MPAMPAMPYAAFILAPAHISPSGPIFAAVTRPDSSALGLPGGKLLPGETPRQAAIREAYEEGWGIIGLAAEPSHTATIDDHEIVWFAAVGAFQLPAFTEQNRGTPVLATANDIRSSGFGNAEAIAAYFGLVTRCARARVPAPPR